RQRPGRAKRGRAQQGTAKKLSSSRFHTVSVPPRRQNLPKARPICPPAENDTVNDCARSKKSPPGQWRRFRSCGLIARHRGTRTDLPEDLLELGSAPALAARREIGLGHQGRQLFRYRRG